MIGGLGTKRRRCLSFKRLISLDCWRRKERRLTLSADRREGLDEDEDFGTSLRAKYWTDSRREE